MHKVDGFMKRSSKLEDSTPNTIGPSSITDNWNSLNSIINDVDQDQATPNIVKNKNIKLLLNIIATKIAPEMSNTNLFDLRTTRKIYVLTTDTTIEPIDHSMLKVIHINRTVEEGLMKSKILFLSSATYSISAEQFEKATENVNKTGNQCNSWDSSANFDKVTIADHTMGSKPSSAPVNKKKLFHQQFFKSKAASFGKIADKIVDDTKNKTAEEIGKDIIKAYKALKCGIPPSVTCCTILDSDVFDNDETTLIDNDVLADPTGKVVRVTRKEMAQITSSFFKLTKDESVPSSMSIDLGAIKDVCIPLINSFAELFNTYYKFSRVDGLQSFRSVARKLTNDGPKRKAAGQFLQLLTAATSDLSKTDEFYQQYNIQKSDFGNLVDKTPIPAFWYLVMGLFHTAKCFTSFRISETGVFRDFKKFKDFLRGGLVFSEAEPTNMRGFIELGNANASEYSVAMRYTGASLLISTGIFPAAINYTPSDSMSDMLLGMGAIHKSSTRSAKLERALRRLNKNDLLQTPEEAAIALIHGNLFTEVRIESEEKALFLASHRFGTVNGNFMMLPYYKCILAMKKRELATKTTNAADALGINIAADNEALGLNQLGQYSHIRGAQNVDFTEASQETIVPNDVLPQDQNEGFAPM